MIPHSRSWSAILILMLVAVLLIGLISVPARASVPWYVAPGGNDSKLVTSSCYSNPWQFTSSLYQGRTQHAVVAVGNYIYVIGGADPVNWSALDSVEYAAIQPDGTLGPWQIVSHMTTWRYQLTSFAANGHIYAISGDQAGELAGSEQAQVNSDGTLGPWQPVNSPTSIQASAAIAVGNFLYVLGGDGPAGGGGPLKSVERATINADGSLGLWQFMSSMNVARQFPAAVLEAATSMCLEGIMVLCPSTVLKERQSHTDGTLGPWQMQTPMLTGRGRR